MCQAATVMPYSKRHTTDITNKLNPNQKKDIMENDLRGLNKAGFQNFTEDFDSSIFENNETIELLRPEIKKYFAKIKTANKNHSSYGLKHIAERHIGTYVSNGELIYAMHLEGYKIFHQNINCSFNVSELGIRHMSNAKSILKTLKTPLNREITDYLKFNNRPLRYKYHLKFLIDSKFRIDSRLKSVVTSIISKEINETPETVKSWIKMLTIDKEEISFDKLDMLSKIFNVSPEKLINKVAEIEN